MALAQTFRTTLALGGSIQPSLPSSFRNANKRLESLRVNQAKLKSQSAALTNTIKDLTKEQAAATPGTAEHTQVTNKLTQAQAELSALEPQIRS